MLFSGRNKIAGLPMAGCCQSIPKLYSIFMTKPLGKICAFLPKCNLPTSFKTFAFSVLFTLRTGYLLKY